MTIDSMDELIRYYRTPELKEWVIHQLAQNLIDGMNAYDDN